MRRRGDAGPMKFPFRSRAYNILVSDPVVPAITTLTDGVIVQAQYLGS